ncbi:MAG: hypothetical protein MJZ31_06235 [Bacteroidales bacterium]|nr:hypothetical protein [Bacteroidales bacterium]
MLQLCINYVDTEVLLHIDCDAIENYCASTEVFQESNLYILVDNEHLFGFYLVQLVNTANQPS